MYVQTASGLTKIIGQAVTFQRSGSRLVSGVTAGIKAPKMLAHYSHVRIDAKRRALDTLSSGGPSGAYGTNRDTNSAVPSKPGPQVVAGNGRPVRARTADLHRVKVAL
jgi:hypothetical protein